MPHANTLSIIYIYKSIYIYIYIYTYIYDEGSPDESSQMPKLVDLFNQVNNKLPVIQELWSCVRCDFQL